MGLLNPEVGGELDKFSEKIGEGERFYLDGIRVISGVRTDYGVGEMVAIKARGHDNELGIWGEYLLHQAKAVQPSDLHQWYIVVREVVPGFSERPVKVIKPAPAPAATQSDEPDF